MDTLATVKIILGILSFAAGLVFLYFGLQLIYAAERKKLVVAANEIIKVANRAFDARTEVLEIQLNRIRLKAEDDNNGGGNNGDDNGDSNGEDSSDDDSGGGMWDAIPEFVKAIAELLKVNNGPAAVLFIVGGLLILASYFFLNSIGA